MNIIEKRVKDLKPYEKNPRLNDDAVKYVAESISQFGFRVPIVIDKDNNIVCGHTRWKACKKLKIETVPCVVADDLTEEQIRAYRLADNRVAEKAEWDLALLDTELAEIETIDMTLLGFDDKEEEAPQEVVEDDFDEEPPAEPIAKYGDLYQLGRHRLMCGDSTKIDDVEKLMGGHKADMVFTDPPYGVNYMGGVIHGSKINTNHKRDMLKNDDVDIYAEFMPLLNEVIDDGAIYIFYATRNTYELFKSLKESDIEVNSIIVWNKINTGYADMNSHYKNKYEPFVYGKRKGKTLNFVGATSECTVWDIKKDRVNKLHPTQKPIELPARAIQNSSCIDNIVLDLFGGSGSTLIACEQTNRRCFMMELDPKYIDVIINRWETFTGQKAVKLNAD